MYRTDTPQFVSVGKGIGVCILDEVLGIVSIVGESKGRVIER
jgi:hypothetical protein